MDTHPQRTAQDIYQDGTTKVAKGIVIAFVIVGLGFSIWGMVEVRVTHTHTHTHNVHLVDGSHPLPWVRSHARDAPKRASSQFS